MCGYAGDVGRVQARAGTQAALDGLKLAEGPRDMSRIARLAATKGGKTRAILKLVGRGAILLTFGTFQLAMWLLWALLTIIGFASALKRMTERATERYCARRKLCRARALAQREQHERERCAREQRLAALHFFGGADSDLLDRASRIGRRCRKAGDHKPGPRKACLHKACPVER